MNDVVQNAAFSAGLTTKGLLVRIATERGFTNNLEVGEGWWRKRLDGNPMPPYVYQECQRIVDQTMAFSHG